MSSVIEIPEWIVQVRHADGGSAYRGSGSDRAKLQSEVDGVLKRSAAVLSKTKADGMTVTWFRRVDS